MKIGIVGLPSSGKTVTFNALTGEQAEGGRRELHQAVVPLPDPRLDRLFEIFQRPRKVPAHVEYVDLAGIAPDEHKRAGFSDQFLGQIRTVDALLVILRGFSDETVPHPLNSIDPVRDLAQVEAEFIISDLAILETRLDRLERQLRTHPNDHDAHEREILLRCQAHLESERPLRDLEFDAGEEILIRGYQFITQKPQIVMLNIDESDLPRESECLRPLESGCGPNSTAIAVCAQIEMEIRALSEEEAEPFRRDLGITETVLARLISTSYRLLGLISFFTLGDQEVRAWTIRNGTRAPAAAGAVHSDMERGFIRAEVVNYDDFITRASMASCRSDGVLRLEGRDYIVRDGDIVTFRFAV